MQDQSIAAERPPIACYVINLARDNARLEAVAKGLAESGVTFKRHPAVNGKRHSRFIRRSLGQSFFSQAKGRPMTDGEIGCSLSHLSVYRRMLREGVEKALVLEDDAVFAPEFAAFFAGQLGPLLDRFDIVKVEGIFFDHVSAEGTVLAAAGETKAVLPLRPSLGTAAYAVTRRGAQRLLKALAKVDDPLDIKLVQYERHRARYVELRPMLVQQADVASILESDRVHAENGDAAAAQSAMAKLTNKIGYMRRVAGRLVMWFLWTAESRLRGGPRQVAP